jgi:hypothetical protein
MIIWTPGRFEINNLRNPIKQGLTALEREVHADAPATAKVSEIAAEIIRGGRGSIISPASVSNCETL